jgi:hypothetical protein
MAAQQSLEEVFNKERRRGLNRALEVSLASQADLQRRLCTRIIMAATGPLNQRSVRVISSKFLFNNYNTPLLALGKFVAA